MKHIVFTIDSRFVCPCAVAMVSALQNNRGDELFFHIVAQQLPEEECGRLIRIVERYDAQIRFYDVPDEKIRGYELRWEKQRLSKVVFYRCVLASILPLQVTKVLYLDCDLLVLSSLDELWDTDLGGVALAVVPDAYTVNVRHCQRLGYDAADNYFNGGVLLLNLAYWRGHGLEQQCKHFYQAHADRMLYNDQDLLNGMFHGHKVLLDMKWNVQESAYRISQKGLADDSPLYMETLKHPSILHYSGRKPWQYHCMHPLRMLYFEYERQLPEAWRKETDKWWVRLHRFIHLLPYTLRLKENKYIDLN